MFDIDLMNRTGLQKIISKAKIDQKKEKNDLIFGDLDSNDIRDNNVVKNQNTNSTKPSFFSMLIACLILSAFIIFGIFSAEKLASSVFKADTLSKYIIVRFITSSSLEVIYINDGLFSLYGRFNIVKNKINPIKVFGDKSSIDDVVLTLEQIVKGRKSLSNIDKAFMYQSSGQSKLIKNLVNKKYNDIVLLDLFNHRNHKSLNSNVGKTISRTSFCELGFMFGDLNV